MTYRSWIFLIGMALCFSGCSKKLDIKNTLRVRSQAKIKSLDPALAEDAYSNGELMRTYESLFAYHYIKRPYVLIPALAEAMPNEEAGTIYTIPIKRGIRFQDDPCFKESSGKGRELTAEDVVYSYLRVADPKMNSPGWWVFEDKIVGLNEWREQNSKKTTTDYSQKIEGLQAIDRYTVRFKLRKPLATFLNLLATSISSVVPKEAVELYGKDFSVHPVGTGPFILSEFNPNSKVVWVRNPNYRKEPYPEGDDSLDRGKPTPFLDKVIVSVIEEYHPTWLKFLEGSLDEISVGKDFYAHVLTQEKELNPELQAKGIKMIKEMETDFVHMTFNMADPLLGKSRALRQAISLAINKKEYIKIFYGGNAVQAHSPVPPTVFGYDPTFKNPYSEYDLARAKKLLAQAGYPEGKGLPPLEFLGRSDTTSRQVGEFIQKELGEIGIQVKISTSSWPEFVSKMKNKQGQLWTMGWGAYYPDAENLLQLFYGKNLSPGPNDSNYVNPKFDLLFEKSLALRNGPEKKALIKQMISILAEDCPNVFIAHREDISLYRDRVKNSKAVSFVRAPVRFYRVVDP